VRSLSWKNRLHKALGIGKRLAKLAIAFYRRHTLVIQYGIGFGLLALVIYWQGGGKLGKPTDQQKALSLVAGAAVDVKAQQDGRTPSLIEAFSGRIDLEYLALACVLWCISLFITFIRWYILVRAQDLPFTIRNAIRLGLVSYYFNSILPGSVGGDILKAVAVAREQSRRTVAVATIVIDRVIGLWALAWLVALAGGIFWALGNPLLVNNVALKTIVLATWGIVVTSAIVWSLMGLFSADRSEAMAKRLEGVPKLGVTLAELWRAGWMYRRKKKAVAIALGMTLVGHFGWVLIFHLCVSAFPDIDSATFAEHILIVPVGMTAQAMFPMPGGVGGGEAAYGWLYTLLGRAAIGGILGCLVQRVVAWGIGFIGYIIYTRMPRTELAAGAEPAPVPAPSVP
jgi:glycosyltransferase 2 family protein